jgi:hypothetical protein
MLGLCPIEGAVFLCGDVMPVVLREHGFVRDPSLAAGLPGDRVVSAIAGRWPDSAWLVYAYGGVGNWSYTVYRWRETRWMAVLDVPPASAAQGINVVTWHGAVFARVTDIYAEKLESRGPVMHLLEGTMVMPASVPWPRSKKKDGCAAELIPEPALAEGADGRLYGLGFACDSGKRLLERWTWGVAKPEVIEVPEPSRDGECFGSAAFAPDGGLALLGSCGQQRPYMERFDGQTWTEVDMPQVEGEALQYLDDGNAEWLVSGSNIVTDHNTLSRRPHGGTWQPVPLPPIALTEAQRDCVMGGTTAGGETDAQPPVPVAPVGVATIGGDTWVEATIAGTGGCGTAGMILRTRPVDEPLSFWH